MQIENLKDHSPHRLFIKSAYAVCNEPDMATAYVLRQCGLSYEDIAESMGVPEGTVKTRIHRARKRMKPALAVLQATNPEVAGTEPVTKRMVVRNRTSRWGKYLRRIDDMKVGETTTFEGVPEDDVAAIRASLYNDCRRHERKIRTGYNSDKNKLMVTLLKSNYQPVADTVKDADGNFPPSSVRAYAIDDWDTQSNKLRGLSVEDTTTMEFANSEDLEAFRHRVYPFASRQDTKYKTKKLNDNTLFVRRTK